MKHKLNDCKIFAIMTSCNLLDLAVATPLASCAVPPYSRVRARFWNGTDCSRRAREFSIVPANECHNLYEKTDPLAIQTGIEARRSTIELRVTSSSKDSNAPGRSIRGGIVKAQSTRRRFSGSNNVSNLPPPLISMVLVTSGYAQQMQELCGLIQGSPIAKVHNRWQSKQE
jgi:hypothetical protein